MQLINQIYVTLGKTKAIQGENHQNRYAIIRQHQQVAQIDVDAESVTEAIVSESLYILDWWNYKQAVSNDNECHESNICNALNSFIMLRTFSSTMTNGKHFITKNHISWKNLNKNLLKFSGNKSTVKLQWKMIQLKATNIYLYHVVNISKTVVSNFIAKAMLSITEMR